MDVIAEIARVLKVSNPTALHLWWDLPYPLQKRLIIFGLGHQDERIALTAWYLRREQGHDRTTTTLGSPEDRHLCD